VAGRLLTDAPLTQLAHESGFTDSAHPTHAWQRSFGLPPSYTRDRSHVHVIR
jgi:AraC-like DNA-binding protein